MMSTAEQSNTLPRMTYEDFLRVYDGMCAEWVDGEVILTGSSSGAHQDMVFSLYEAVHEYIEYRDLGKVLGRPFQMRLARTGREPDVLFMAKEHLGRLHEMYFDGPADLAIEVTSPESNTRDRVEKFEEYAAAGVPEYWLIDPEEHTAEFYVLGAEGRYHPIEPDGEGRYHSTALPGFWLLAPWFTSEELPDYHTILFTVGGQVYADYLFGHLRGYGASIGLW